MSYFIYLLSALSIVGTHIPRIRSKHWFVRDQHYFKAVYLGLNTFLLIITLFILPLSVPAFLISVLLVFSIISCVVTIYPFTRFHRKSVADATKQNSSPYLNIIISNVYQYNDDFQKLLNIIDRRQPDIILLLETDDKWDRATKPLQEKYGEVIKEIKDDTYGILFISRFPLESRELHYFTTNELPSVEASFKLGDRTVRLIGIHPKPPLPGETSTSRIKDHEIIKAGNYLMDRGAHEAKLLLGDLNDVAWSETSIKLQEMTNLKDPRVGRGFFSTFPVYLPIRFPLDHLFCSGDFRLNEFIVEEDMGSDHFPVYISLQLN